MKRLTISSQKGGVGKTTVAVNLSYALARRGWRTLLVDTDPQGAVGLSLSRKARMSRGFYDALAHGLNVSEIVTETRLPELKILTAGQRESFYELGPDLEGAEGVGKIFEDLERMGFDLMLVDTAAGVFGATAEILRLSDYVLIPQQAEPLGARSIPQILEVVADLREGASRAGSARAGRAAALSTSREAAAPAADDRVTGTFFRSPPGSPERLRDDRIASRLAGEKGIPPARRARASRLEVAGVLLTMTQKNKPECANVARELRGIASPGLVLETEIPRDDVFMKASVAGVPVALLYEKAPPAAVAFDQLAAELEERMKLGPVEGKREYSRLLD